MPAPVHVARPPQRPVLIFDGDCNFCRFWIARWQRLTGDHIEYLPFQHPSIGQRFPELPPALCERAVQLVLPNGQVWSAAAAVFRSLAHNPSLAWPLWFYETIPGIALFTEASYRVVARHRTTFSFLTRLLWGLDSTPPSFGHVRRLFLSCLGLIYLAAFLSLWPQIHGLLGSNGILPATEFMDNARRYFDGQGVGVARYWRVPTGCWLSTSDPFLHVLCGAGTISAVLLVLGIAPVLNAGILWALYLSLTTVGQDFLLFQWDALLLEAGFLAIFLAPFQLLPNRPPKSPVSTIVLWLFRWLLFRLMFESGWVKLLSGDANWWGLTALNVHYETQPLPTWLGWYAHQLPSWFQKGCVVALLAIELVVPLFTFGPRRLRLVAWWSFAVLQLWILATGNYGFFNYLTLALSLVLLDDAALQGVFRRRRPAGIRAHGAGDPEAPPADALSPASPVQRNAAPSGPWPRWVLIPLAVVLLGVGGLQLCAMFRWQPAWFAPAQGIARLIAPIHVVNSYGLFAVMTTTRPEIRVEGSNDRVTWLAYEFRYKPGPVRQRPAFVAPHQPRLDWQMWFAALGTYRENQWFIRFCVRLLQGSPEVLGLLKSNPFPNQPPRYIRAVVSDYHFTDPSTRAKDQAWWKAEDKGEYLPTLSLRDAR